MTKTDDISEIIAGRRTIHQFKSGEIPPEEEILKAIDLAVCAPNHHSTKPWRFYLIGEQTKEKICLLNSEMIREARGDEAAKVKLKRWREIPGWLLVTCTRSDNGTRAREDYAACCCAAQNLMLYLWSKGIGVKWTTGDVTLNPLFHEIVNLDPDAETVVGLFWYGYPLDITKSVKKSSKIKIKKLS